MKTNYYKPQLPPIKCKCECGTEFIPSRRDKLFVNKRHFDFYYNSQVRLQCPDVIRITNKKLKKNYAILEELLRKTHDEEVMKSKDFLLGMGFIFSVFTSQFEFQTVTWFKVYDIYFCFNDEQPQMVKITRIPPPRKKLRRMRSKQ